MAWDQIILAAITLIIGPLLAFGLKVWWQGREAKTIAEKVQKEDAARAQKDETAIAHETRIVNESIDAQRKAREEWAKGQK